MSATVEERVPMPAMVRALLAAHAGALRLLVLIFFTHGAVYFLVPIAVKDPTHPLKLVKYVVLALMVLLSAHVISVARALLVAAIAALLAGWHFLGVSEPSLTNFITYCAPLTALLLYDALRGIDFRTLARTTLIIASVLTYVEVIVLGGIYRNYFVEGVYRATSIFASPNVLSPMVALLTYYLLVQRWWRSPVGQGIAIANIAGVTALTGSKTGMVVSAMLVVAALYELGGASRARLAVLAGAVTLVAIIAEVAGVVAFSRALEFGDGGVSVRAVELGSGLVRLTQYELFLDAAAAWPLFPWYRELHYADNVYLHIWGMFGLLALVSFLAFNAWLIARLWLGARYRLMYVFVLLMVVGLSTNFAYLWPLAYIYWFLVAAALAGGPPAGYGTAVGSDARLEAVQA